jgi:hypothetical protein
VACEPTMVLACACGGRDETAQPTRNRATISLRYDSSLADPGGCLGATATIRLAVSAMIPVCYERKSGEPSGLIRPP